MRDQKTIGYPDKKGYAPQEAVAVGGVVLCNDNIEYNTHATPIKLEVHNTGDRPIQVGSHFHFFEVNRYLEFDRSAAFGTHLNIPATTAVRFEPGESKEVEVIAFGGKQRIIGFNGLVEGYVGEEDSPTYLPRRHKAIMRAHKRGFRSTSKGCDHKEQCNDSKTSKTKE